MVNQEALTGGIDNGSVFKLWIFMMITGLEETKKKKLCTYEDNRNFAHL